MDDASMMSVMKGWSSILIPDTATPSYERYIHFLTLVYYGHYCWDSLSVLFHKMLFIWLGLQIVSQHCGTISHIFNITPMEIARNWRQVYHRTKIKWSILIFLLLPWANCTKAQYETETWSCWDEWCLQLISTLIYSDVLSRYQTIQCSSSITLHTLLPHRVN